MKLKLSLVQLGKAGQNQQQSDRLKPGMKTRLPKGPIEEIVLKYEMAGKNYAL